MNYCLIIIIYQQLFDNAVIIHDSVLNSKIDLNIEKYKIFLEFIRCRINVK